MGEQFGRVGRLHRAAVENPDFLRDRIGEVLREQAADKRVHFLRLLGRGDLAGADGPHGFVGDHDAGGLVFIDAFETGFELSLDDRKRGTGFAFGESFTDAEDGAELVFKCGQDFFIHERIGLAKERTPLAVAEDDVRGEERAQHRRGNFAGEGAAGFEVHVLRAELERGAVERFGGAFERGERRAHDDFDVGLLADGGDELSDERDAVGRGFVHLPITGDEFFASGHDNKEKARRRKSGDARLRILVFEEGHAGEDFTLEEFEGGAAAGGAMGDFVRDLEFLRGRGGVAAADDGRGAVSRGFGDGGGHGFGGAGKFFEFKHARGSVPDDGLGAEDGLAVEFDGLRARVEAAPAVGNTRGEIGGHGVGVGREGVGADEVDREDQLDVACGRFGDEFFDDLGAFGVVEAGANRCAAEDFVKRVSHAAADDDFIGFLEEIFDERDFVGDLGATENGEQRAVRMIEDFGEGFEFGFHEETSGFEREGDADHGAVRAVSGAESVIDEDVTELGQRSTEGRDGGRIGFLGGAVLELHFAFFFDVETEILKEDDGAGREFGARGFDGGADAVVEKSHGAA